MPQREPGSSAEVLEAPSAPDLTAEQPGRYRLEELIAEGGQSRVHRAWDAHLGREVAFKQPISSPESRTRTLDRFLREARITARLEHPNIVPVYEIGRRTDGTLYCTQKLVRGPDGVGPARTLADELAATTSLRERLALLPHFAAVCNATAYAHEQGIVHRDIKPANVLLGGFGETVLADWGLAKVKGDRVSAGEGANTAEGVPLGTPRYRSPEQARGWPADERTDVWSLGVMLWELLAGGPPVGIEDHPGDPPSVLGVSPEAPPELAAIAAKALRHDIGQRYRSANSMAADVSAWLAGRRVTAYDYSAVELARLFVTRHRTLASVVAVTVVLLAISGAALWQSYLLARENLALALVEQARRAEGDLQWDRAAVLYARARVEHDGPDARWGAMLAANRPVAPIARHRLGAALLDLAWSADGARLAASGHDGSLALVDREGRVERRASGHASAVAAVAFSPDGRWLATSGHDGRLLLHDLTSTEPPRELLTSGDSLNAVAFSPDGAALAVGGEDGAVVVFSPVDGRERFRASATGPVYGVAFAEGGAVVVAGSWDNTLRLWDLPSGKERAVIDASPGLEKGRGSVLGIAVSPDGALIATAGRDRDVRVWRVKDGASEARLEGHRGKVQSVSFSPDGKVLASGGDDRTVRLWDMTSRQPLVGDSFGLEEEVHALAFAPDGRRLAWGGGEHLSLREIVRPPELAGVTERIYSLAFSPDGTRLMHADKTSLLVRNAADLSEVLRIEVGNKLQADGSFSPDGRTIASSCLPASDVCLLDATTGRELRRWTLDSWIVQAIAFSPDGALLAAAGSDRVVRLVDLATGTVVRTLAGHETTVFDLAFSPDGAVLASASYDKTARLWDPRTGDALATLRGHAHGVRRIVFSPDGTQLATTSWDKTARLWDVATRRETLRLAGHEDFVFGAAFSPDASWLATASWDGTLRVWSLPDGREVARFVSDESRIFTVVVAPDGGSLFYGGLKAHRLALRTPGDAKAELAGALARTHLRFDGLRLVRAENGSGLAGRDP